MQLNEGFLSNNLMECKITKIILSKQTNLNKNILNIYLCFV